MSAEVASTRLPKEILREIDREAARRGVSRSVYLADLIERGALREPSTGGAEAFGVALTNELREIRESERSLRDALRDIQAALKAGVSASGAAGPRLVSSPAASPAVLDRLMFSTFFSEALIKRVSALLYRSPGELSQVVRDAREQAEAEARLWRERQEGGDSKERQSS